MDNHRTLLAIAALGAAAVSALIWGAGPAGAGVYRAAQCHPDIGAGHPDVAFERNTDHYRSRDGCAAGGNGLAVYHDADHTAGGRWGAWTLRAPEGTEIVRARVRARGRARAGHVPELLIGTASAGLRRFASPREEAAPFTWSGSAGRRLLARLRCSRRSRCGEGIAAEVHVRRLLVYLRDHVAPVLGVGGPLLDAGSRRGSHELTAVAADRGGGVRRVVVEVNGEPLHAVSVHCALTDGYALRLRPCPPKTTGTVAADTAAPPFRQGPNELRACAFDYARNTAANRACESRRLRVDNACPLSDIPGARLRARQRSAGVSSGRGRAVVIGRLLDASGGGVEGARVCVATRVRLPSVPERVLRTALTGAQGRFRVRLPAGPNREIRVAHWRDPETALERFLDLRVRARPRLRVSPDRVLRNGERARFRVRLPGPRAGRRRVVLQARAGGRWIAVRTGRSSRRGLWRTTYRFRATSGERRYRFRALVPRQRGYPYAAGHSKVRRQTVVG